MFSIFQDKYLRAIFSLSFLILIFASIMTFLKIGKISGPLIVHFDVFSGVDFLGRRAEIFGILTSAFAIVFLNAFLADFFYNRERFLSYVFSFGSAGLCLLILIAMGVIISVN